MATVHIFGKRYMWLMDHDGHLHLHLISHKNTGSRFVFDETLVKCERFPPDIDWGISNKKYLSGGVYEVAYALCEKYLQTNGDSNA